MRRVKYLEQQLVNQSLAHAADRERWDAERQRLQAALVARNPEPILRPARPAKDEPVRDPEELVPMGL